MGDRIQAMRFFNTAVQALQAKDNPQKATHAYNLFSSACLTDPTWWEAHYQAGNNCSDLNNTQAAIACYRRALECEMKDEERGRVFTNLGWKLHQLGKTKEAIRYSLQATKLAPNEPYAWVNLSCLELTLCNTVQALKYAQEAYRLSPQDPTVQTAYAFALLFDGRYASGFRAFGSRFAYELKNFLQFPYPEWRGEEGKTIYLVSDQGLGDTLSFARFTRMACERSKYVHAFVHPELMRAFTHAFVDISNLNLSPSPTPTPPADYWTTFVSLPYALDLNDDQIKNTPPVPLPVIAASKNWRVPDRKLHIGIAWFGSALNKINVHRSIPFEQFFDLYRVSGVQLYSLQVGEKANELHEKGGTAIIRDMVPFIRDVVDTVAILQHMDLVIGCESALGHICAAIGKEFWMPYSYQGRDYRVGVDGTKRLWSPKHRIFCQSQDCTWGPVFQEIVEALRERIDVVDNQDAESGERPGHAVLRSASGSPIAYPHADQSVGQG